MLGPFSQRILTLLQLTRMALVFTAIADSAAEILLRAAKAGADAIPHRSYLDFLDLKCLAAMAITSVGLYGFGMSLNDIIDRRRDSRLAADRPLPSGRVRLVTAHTICGGLALMAICGGTLYAHWTEPTGMMSLMLIAATGAVITFYDFAGKYLVALGLLSLGVIRFLQATVAAPQLPLIWHPLLLLDHVALLSAVGYHWEEKRPHLGPAHWWTVIGGLWGINLLLIIGIGWKRGNETVGGLPAALDMRTALLLPMAAIIVFIRIAYMIRKRNPVAREAGQKLMLYGLLWLIVYDAAFVAGYVSWTAGLVLLALLPIAWWSVKLMRAWSKLVALSQRPTFQRART
jgi:4-hydroxybenzoate polyprenyltransferase